MNLLPLLRVILVVVEVTPLRILEGTLQEQAAVRECQAGKLAGLGVLFQLHQQAVFRTAYGIVRSQDLAEDITQQVFIQLFSSIKRYDLKRPFAPWLHRIAVNRSLDALRHHKGRTVPIEVASDLPSQDTTPERAAEDSELRGAIRGALGALRPKHRAAIVLRYYQGFGEAEMAVALHCRQGTVKSRLHNALRQLRDILAVQAPHLGEPEPDLKRASAGVKHCSSNPDEEQL